MAVAFNSAESNMATAESLIETVMVKVENETETPVQSPAETAATIPAEPVAATPATTPTKTRRDLSVAEKSIILERFDALPRMSQLQAAMELGISQPLLAKILKNRFNIQCMPLDRLARRRKRSGKDKEIESALKEYYIETCKQGICLSGPALRKKATDLAKELGKDTFKVTEGWFNRWKKREGIVLEKSLAAEVAKKFLPHIGLEKMGNEEDYHNDNYPLSHLGIDDVMCDPAVEPAVTVEEGESSPPRVHERLSDASDLSMKSVQNHNHHHHRDTEFDVFGMSIAAQLNAMPWDKAIELQTHIQSLMTDFRLKLHRQSSHLG